VKASEEGQSVPDEAARLALFTSLVETIREVHVFNAPPHGPSAEWEALLPGLEAEFKAADDLVALNIALRHLGNSLRNPHCSFTPGGPLKGLPSDRLTPGFRLKQEMVGGVPRLYLDSVDDESLGVMPGDVLVAVDGVADPIATYSLESSQNFMFGVARYVAQYLSSPKTDRSTFRLEQPTQWTFERRDGGEQFDVETVWTEPKSPPRPHEFTAFEYEGDVCGTLSARDYGPGYRRTAAGLNYCLYVSDHPDFQAFPVVRHFSFLYLPTGYTTDVYHAIRAEWYSLSSHLAALEAVEGVVLDLRDNNGGYSPNLFLSWWATKPWDTGYAHKRARDVLLKEPFLSTAFRRSFQLDAYREQLKTADTDSDFLPPTVWDPPPDGGMTRRPERRVIERPVALLVGPGCLSSCDFFSLVWSRNEMGPIVGERTAAGYTAWRANLPVRVGNMDLGTLSVALQYESMGDDHASVEAIPIPLTVPIDRTFDNAETYDAEVVAAAIDSLRAEAHTAP